MSEASIFVDTGVWNWGLGCFFGAVFGGVMAGWAVFRAVRRDKGVPNVLFFVLNLLGFVRIGRRKS